MSKEASQMTGAEQDRREAATTDQDREAERVIRDGSNAPPASTTS